MLAGPTSTLATMRKALAFTIHALDSAAEIDIDRMPDDRKFFAAEKDKLHPLVAKLEKASHDREQFELGPGMRLQARVELGDAVLDRGVRTGNARTKLALRDKPGLPASHAFGERVTDLTEAPLRLEPEKVLEAARRIDDLPEFDGKAAIKADLEKRAKKQETLLMERDKGFRDETTVSSEAVRLIAETADALAVAKAALDGRFVRQRPYVGSFFLDVGGSRTPHSTPPTGEKPPSSTQASGSEPR